MAITSLRDNSLNPTQQPGNFTNTATGSGATYKYVTFTASGTLTVDRAGFFQLLVIGGGSSNGAGGMLEVAKAYLPVGSYTITVGAGGSIGTASLIQGSGFLSLGQNGSGPGGNSWSGGTPPGTPTLGNPGGTGVTGYAWTGAGGGGAGGPGSPNSGNNGGPGGSSKASSITGSSVDYCGGGGGGGDGGSNGAGGGAGAGAGGAAASIPNRGSGGSTGSSGVVIVRVNF